MKDEQVEEITEDQTPNSGYTMPDFWSAMFMAGDIDAEELREIENAWR